MLLRQERVDGSWTEAEFLRPLSWFAAMKISKCGDYADLDLPEMSVSGRFQVLAMGACPEIAAGLGCIVTGLFRHASGVVLDVYIEGESAPIGVTGLHPFWSEDRQSWVSVKDLHAGERVLSTSGARCIEKIPRVAPNRCITLKLMAIMYTEWGSKGYWSCRERFKLQDRGATLVSTAMPNCYAAMNRNCQMPKSLMRATLR